MKKFEEKAKKIVKGIVEDTKEIGKNIAKETDKITKQIANPLKDVKEKQRQIGAEQERQRIATELSSQATAANTKTQTLNTISPATEEQNRNSFVRESVGLYIANMTQDGVYGGDIEIKAIAEIYKRSIEIWSKTKHEDGSKTYDRNDYSIATPALIEANTPIRLLLSNANTEGAHYNAIYPSFMPANPSRSQIKPPIIRIAGDGNCLFAAGYVAHHVNAQNLQDIFAVLPSRAAELRQAVCSELARNPVLLEELFNNILTRAQEHGLAIGANIFAELPIQRNFREQIQNVLEKYYPGIVLKKDASNSGSDSDISDASSDSLNEFASLGIHQHLLSFDAHDAEVLKFLSEVSQKYIKSLPSLDNTGGIIELIAIANIWDCKIELNVYKESAKDIQLATKPEFETVLVKDAKNKDVHKFTMELRLVDYGSPQAYFVPAKINNVAIDLGSIIETANSRDLFNVLAAVHNKIYNKSNLKNDDIRSAVQVHLSTMLAKCHNTKCPSIWDKQNDLIAGYFKDYIYAVDDAKYADLLAVCSQKTEALHLRNVRRLLLKLGNELITTVTNQVQDEIASWHITDHTQSHRRLSSDEGNIVSVTAPMSVAMLNLQRGCTKLGNALATAKSTLYTNMQKRPINFVYTTVFSAISSVLDYMSEYWYSATLYNHTIAASISRALSFLGNMTNVYAGFLDDMQHIQDIGKHQTDLIENLPIDMIVSIAFVNGDKVSEYFNEAACKTLSVTKLKEYWAISDKMEFVIKDSPTVFSISHAESHMLKWLCDRWAYSLITISSMAQVCGTTVTLLSLQQQLDNCGLSAPQEYELEQELVNDTNITTLFNVTYGPTMSPTTTTSPTTIDCSENLVASHMVNMNLSLTALNYVLWNYTQISGPIHKYDLELTNALLAVTETVYKHKNKVPAALTSMLTTYSAEAEMAKALSKLPTKKELQRGVRKTIMLLKKHVVKSDQVLANAAESGSVRIIELKKDFDALAATIVTLSDKSAIDAMLFDDEASNTLLEQIEKLSTAIKQQGTSDKAVATSADSTEEVATTPMFKRLSRSLSKAAGALTFSSYTKGKKSAQQDKANTQTDNEMEIVDETAGLMSGTQPKPSNI